MTKPTSWSVRCSIEAMVPEVNELLRGWTRNGQVLPGGLPADLRDFIGRARQLPVVDR